MYRTWTSPCGVTRTIWAVPASTATASPSRFTVSPSGRSNGAPAATGSTVPSLFTRYTPGPNPPTAVTYRLPEASVATEVARSHGTGSVFRGVA